MRQSSHAAQLILTEFFRPHQIFDCQCQMKTTNNKFRMQSPLFCDSSSSLNQTYLLRSTFARFHPCFSCSVVFFTWKCVKRLWSLSLFPSSSGLVNSLTQCPSTTISFLCYYFILFAVESSLLSISDLCHQM